jgi:ribosomal protein S18 acetylase RimI-like enzyme
MRLVPMTQQEYDAWMDDDIREFAEDKVKSGAWQPEDALERSRQTFSRLLPDGLATKDHCLYRLQDEAANRKVGMIWVAVIDTGGKPTAYIYDIVVDEDQRGKGYGKQAMLAVEETVRALGLDTIGLHVFGHNAIARDLYLKVGYEITDYNMAKKIE